MKRDAAYVCVTRDGLAPWKKLAQTLPKARELGFECAVAVDSRTTDLTEDFVRRFAAVHRFDNDKPYCEDALNPLIDSTDAEWIWVISDDEEPSEALWSFKPKDRLIYRPHILAPLPGGTHHYAPMETRQPRIFPRDSLRFPRFLGIDVLPQTNLAEHDIPEILWHYTLCAPRDHRERKADEHERAWNENYYVHPEPYPGRKSYLWEDHPELAIAL